MYGWSLTVSSNELRSSSSLGVTGVNGTGVIPITEGLRRTKLRRESGIQGLGVRGAGRARFRGGEAGKTAPAADVEAWEEGI